MLVNGSTAIDGLLGSGERLRSGGRFSRHAVGPIARSSRTWNTRTGRAMFFSACSPHVFEGRSSRSPT